MVGLSPGCDLTGFSVRAVEKPVHTNFTTQDNFEMWISLCASLRKSREKPVGNAGKLSASASGMWKTMWKSLWIAADNRPKQ